MIEQFLAIVRNTFFESIRQPIMLVILVVATIALILANPLSAFTMEDDQRMLLDIGLATVFLAGTLLAVFVAANVLTREIENKTALTVISKPVGRPVFVLGKFIGVAGAILIGTIYMSLVFMLVEQHAVLQTVRDPVHVPVITFSLIAGVIGIGTGIWCNYFYNRVFASTVIVVTTPLVALAYIFSLMFDAGFSPQPISVGFKPHIWLAIICILVALLVLTAVAIASSTRLNQVLTLVVVLGVFVLGLLSDTIFGQPIESLRNSWLERAQAFGLTETVTEEQSVRLITGETTVPVTVEMEVPLDSLWELADPPPVITDTEHENYNRDAKAIFDPERGWHVVPPEAQADGRPFTERASYIGLWIGYAIVPNLQTMLLNDALTQGHVIPISYVVLAVLYGCSYIIVALALAVILFQRREVG